MRRSHVSVAFHMALKKLLPLLRQQGEEFFYASYVRACSCLIALDCLIAFDSLIVLDMCKQLTIRA